MTTNNRTTPATASTLHTMLDDLLTPTRATTPEPPTTAPTATSLVDDLNAIARRSQPRPWRAPAPQPEPVALHEAYEWDPMPTVDDALGLRDRADELEAAIAARVARSDPRPAPATPIMSPLTEARLTKAHQRLDEILG
jgi:hypothetical protein